ncbi:flagellar hook-associated protein 2 [Psychrobacillus glaciei]|uniref:Flagellar hook-associated protein 2 n=1 Tax=Psychrobacillus glaciei TaxID=2283160 RepID=A0A5J6SJW4_9BACI|nr:flagellar hook-associated protein 2 [Psychrobacillus glaciei]QFF98190.1 flagellar hook-associated protein 2 [Psychrobacillus glaciei]
MRITGLASGMDTESMIKDLMKAQRIPLDKITQKKQYTEWQLEDYRSINRKLNDFSNNLFDTMMKQSTFLAKTVNVSSPDAVSIKSVSGTSEFSGTISVSRLASQASMQSNDSIGKNIDTKLTMSKLGYIGTTGSVTINAIDAGGDLKAENTKTIIFDPSTDTLESVLKKINSESGVSAFYDSFSGKIAMTAKNSGNVVGDVEMQVSGDLATFFNLSTNNVIAEQDGNGKSGVNSKFIFNGLETERSSNSFQINGFEISLKQVTTDPTDSSKTNSVSFSSAPDTDKIVDAVKKFVDNYNKLIEELNAKVREVKYRDFQPLSTEQKADMKEKEIELWEEKAKSGTLKNESILTSMLQSMRSALNSVVEGTSGTLRLSDIGITTSKDYLTNGKLEIDETKLREAINADPNKVYEVFAKPGSTEKDTGLASKIRTSIIQSRTKLTDKAGITGAPNSTFSIGRLLKGYDDQITRFEARLKTIESRYYKQFSAMESAIQRANAQSAQLTNAFSNN